MVITAIYALSKVSYMSSLWHRGSIDLVILPHILECIDNPRQLLAEACRIIKPEGHIIICGFNPHSLWGLKKIMGKK